jgi:hypothetical protein
LWSPDHDGSGAAAIINGKAMQEGQQFGLSIKPTYQLTVKSIEDVASSSPVATRKSRSVAGAGAEHRISACAASGHSGPLHGRIQQSETPG